jgi:DNA-binding NarL/FixJ family response regulator
MSKKRILIVDDNSAVRSLVRQAFELEPDFEVSGQAENGLEALDTAETLKPDLVVLDLSMPIMTGLEAAPRIKKRVPHVRIILFTVQEGREIAQLANSGGIDAVISKTKPVSELVSQARMLLAPTEREDDPDALPNAS